MATVQVRYIVDDVDAAIAFYCQHLGFHEEMHPAPAFAMLSRGDLRLALSAPNPMGGYSDQQLIEMAAGKPPLGTLARNELGEKTFASPAISHGQIFLRGGQNLYCIGR